MVSQLNVDAPRFLFQILTSGDCSLIDDDVYDVKAFHSTASSRVSQIQNPERQRKMEKSRLLGTDT